MSTQIVRVMICMAVSVLLLPSKVQASPILLTVQSDHWAFDAITQENGASSSLGFHGSWIGLISRGGRAGGFSSLNSAGGSFQSGSVAAFSALTGVHSGSLFTPTGAGAGSDVALLHEAALGGSHFIASLDDLVNQALASRVWNAATNSGMGTGVGTARVGNGTVTALTDESPTTRVPEPGTALLFGAGALVLWRTYPKLRQRAS